MAAQPCYSIVDSPVGSLLLTSDGRALTGLYPATHRRPLSRVGLVREDSFFTGVREQLVAYFAGTLEHFEIALSLEGTDFQQEVWGALLQIPYGGTWTYQELARHLGRPSAARAVGLANARNPISIIVPCHRVLGASGALTGYAGGLAMKKQLLEHETVALQRGFARTPPLGASRVAPVSQVWA